MKWHLGSLVSLAGVCWQRVLPVTVELLQFSQILLHVRHTHNAAIRVPCLSECVLWNYKQLKWTKLYTMLFTKYDPCELQSDMSYTRLHVACLVRWQVNQRSDLSRYTRWSATRGRRHLQRLVVWIRVVLRNVCNVYKHRNEHGSFVTNFWRHVYIMRLLMIVDITTYHGGFHGDLNETFFVGNVDEKSRKLVRTTHECLQKATALSMWKRNWFHRISIYMYKHYSHVYNIRRMPSRFVRTVKPGMKYRDIGDVIQKHAQANGFSVVRTYCGHGIHR